MTKQATIGAKPALKEVFPTAPFFDAVDVADAIALVATVNSCPAKDVA
jgi:hypothetical protein